MKNKIIHVLITLLFCYIILAIPSAQHQTLEDLLTEEHLFALIFEYKKNRKKQLPIISQVSSWQKKPPLFSAMSSPYQKQVRRAEIAKKSDWIPKEKILMPINIPEISPPTELITKPEPVEELEALEKLHQYSKDLEEESVESTMCSPLEKYLTKENLLLLALENSDPKKVLYQENKKDKSLFAKTLNNIIVSIALIDSNDHETHQTLTVNAQKILDEITFIKSIAPKDGTYSLLNLSPMLLETYAPNLATLTPKNPHAGKTIRYALVKIADQSGTEMTTSVLTNPDKIVSLPGALSIVPINLDALASLVSGISITKEVVAAPNPQTLPASSKISITIPASNLKYPSLATPKSVSLEGYPLFEFFGNYFSKNNAYKGPKNIYGPALNDPTVMSIFNSLIQHDFTIQEALIAMTVVHNGGIINNVGRKFPSINPADISMVIHKKRDSFKKLNTHDELNHRNTHKSKFIEKLASKIKTLEKNKKRR